MVKVQIKKRGKYYQYTFEIAPQDGKRKWITKSGFKTKPEAEREGLKALNEYLETGHSFKPSEISYSDYLDYWMEEYCYINLKHRTIETYKYIIKNHLKPRLGMYRISQITTATIQEAINDIYVERGFAKSYMKSILKVIKSSFDYAAEIVNFIKYDPSIQVKVPKYDEPDGDPVHIFTKEEIYQKQLSKNETLQVRVPLCRLYLQYLDYYESYMEQKDIVGENVEPSNEVKAFLEIKEELNVTSTEEVKQILSSSNQMKAETNRQYAYLSYMKNKANELEKIKSISLENEKGFIKSISISKNMIDDKRSTSKEYCIRIPYSELYIYVPKESVCWISYDNRALVYLIDDKEYQLYDKYNHEQEKVNGEDVESVSQKEKQKVNEFYKSYQV